MSTPMSRSTAEALQVSHAMDMVVRLPPYADDDSLPPEVQVACLESYFSNVRVLIEFLGLSIRKNSIKASDFVPDWTYPTGERADQLRTVEYGFAREQVAHLSKSRVPDGGDPEVNVHPMKLQMLALVIVDVYDNAFLPALRTVGSAQLPQFETAVALARQRLATLFS